MAAPRLMVQKARLRNSPRIEPRSKAVCQVITGAAHGFTQCQNAESQQQSGQRRNQERSAPAVAVSEETADQITQRTAHRRRQIKKAHHPSAYGLGKKIGEESRRNGNEGRLSDADDNVTQQEFVVIVRDCAQQCRQAPDESACRHDPPARKAIGQGHD